MKVLSRQVIRRHPALVSILAIGTGGLLGGSLAQLLGLGWFLGGFLVGTGIVYATIAAVYATITP